MAIHDAFQTWSHPSCEDAEHAPPWLALVRDVAGVLVLRDVWVAAPWGAELLHGIVLHRRGLVVVEPCDHRNIACLVEPNSVHLPCQTVMEAHRRAALLRQHVRHHARWLFPRRLMPRRLVGRLAFDALVLALGGPEGPDTVANQDSVCTTLVVGAAELAHRLATLGPAEKQWRRRCCVSMKCSVWRLSSPVRRGRMKSDRRPGSRRQRG